MNLYSFVRDSGEWVNIQVEPWITFFAKEFPESFLKIWPRHFPEFGPARRSPIKRRSQKIDI